MKIHFRISKNFFVCIFGWLLIEYSLTSLLAAEVFVWQGQNGRTYYSDQPKQGSKTLKFDSGHSYYPIRKVYDGDTVLLGNGTVVRLLGINAPEVDGRNHLAEPGGELSKQWLIKFLRDKKVRMQTDLEKKDKYGRTLAYLFTKDEIHVNELLLKQGMAALSIYPPNIRYVDQLQDAQQQAQAQQAGIWKLDYFQPQAVVLLNRQSYKGWKRLTGQILDIRFSRKYVYLTMTERVELRIKRANLDYFPKLDTYQNKQLIVSGWPKRSKQQFTIPVRHPSAINIIE